MIQKIVFTGLIISFLGLTSCFSPDTIKLDENQKSAHVDSLVQLEYMKLQPAMNESCEKNHDKLVNRAVDSLINVYLDSTKYKY